MKYTNGIEARLGDIIEYEGNTGVVVGNVDTGEVEPVFEKQFGDLCKITDSGLLVHNKMLDLPVAIFYARNSLRCLSNIHNSRGGENG